MANKKRSRRRKLFKFVRQTYGVLTAPFAIIFLTHSNKVHPDYKAGWLRRIALGFQFWYNFSRMTAGTNWRAHLVMAMR